MIDNYKIEDKSWLTSFQILVEWKCVYFKIFRNAFKVREKIFKEQ